MSITGEWVPWSAKVPQIEVETHKVAAPDVVVPTLDTVRHEALLYTWLAEHKPLGKWSVEVRKKKYWTHRMFGKKLNLGIGQRKRYAISNTMYF